MKYKKVAIISHVYSPGPPHELEAFLKDKVEELFFIGHPMSFVKNKGTAYRRYRSGKLIEDREGRIWDIPDLLLFVKDFLANLFIIGQESKPYDLIVALDNLNAASAIWLRALGKTKQAVFYTIDYIPDRFKNRLLNSFYHFLDSYAVAKSDFVWNLSPIMTTMREKRGQSKEYNKKQLVVPIGTHLLPTESAKKDPNLIVFMGHLRPGQGVDLLIDAMPLINKQLPKAKLRLIGSGPLEKDLKKQVKALKLEKVIEMTGFLPTNEAMRQSLLEGSIAVAPYVDDETTFTRYTDPGKPKEYLAAGLPVIITKVPQSAFTIDEHRAGIAIDYNKQQLADAVVALLTSKDLAGYQKRAKALAAESTWDKVFTAAFNKMEEHVKNS